MAGGDQDRPSRAVELLIAGVIKTQRVQLRAIRRLASDVTGPAGFSPCRPRVIASYRWGDPSSCLARRRLRVAVSAGVADLPVLSWRVAQRIEPEMRESESLGGKQKDSPIGQGPVRHMHVACSGDHNAGPFFFSYESFVLTRGITAASPVAKLFVHRR
jgi:hypothetical protein